MGGQTLGFEGLAVSMTFSAIFCIPFAIKSAHVFLSDPHLMARMMIISIMSIVLGFGAELLAFRRYCFPDHYDLETTTFSAYSYLDTLVD
jgi:threonine/homoserine efflux transporter RhtA